MLLRDFITENNLTLDQFAALIDSTAATVSRIARGLHKPDTKTMEAILKATAGAVTPNDFFGIDTGRPGNDSTPEAAA